MNKTLSPSRARRTVFASALIGASVLLASPLALAAEAAAAPQVTPAQIGQGIEGFAWAIANVASNTAQAAASFAKSGVAPEPGDYNAWQRTWNLVSPPKADVPVNQTTDQRFAYPLIATQGGGTKAGYNPRAFYKWQQVNLPASTGARCGNGSPYKIFVNLSPNTRNVQIFMEPGGVCFNYEQCAGKTAWGAFNPEGVPDNYTSLLSYTNGKLNVSTTGALESPIYQRIPLTTNQRLKMQDWTTIYMPYCSGDVHLGDNSKVYTSADGKATRVQHYSGVQNVMATLGWARTNLPRPAQVFLHGQSAGSVGSDAQKVAVRTVLNPSFRQFNMHDSGSMYPGDWTTSSPQEMPSSVMYKRVASELFNFDASKPDARTPLLLVKQALPEFNWRDFSTIRTAYANKWPQDRTLYVQSITDLNFSGFMYQDNPGMFEISAAENGGKAGSSRAFLSPQGRFTTDLHLRDLRRMLSQIDGMSQNTGYFSPSGRTLNASHCLTVINYENTTNPDTGNDVVAALRNLVDLRSPPVFRERASDPYWGLYQPLGPVNRSLLTLLMPDMFTPVSQPN
jgi:hypothetical protein